jgi:hypothetical protein
MTACFISSSNGSSFHGISAKYVAHSSFVLSQERKRIELLARLLQSLYFAASIGVNTRQGGHQCALMYKSTGPSLNAERLNLFSSLSTITSPTM